jgi:hypothetical protein
MLGADFYGKFIMRGEYYVRIRIRETERKRKYWCLFIVYYKVMTNNYF